MVPFLSARTLVKPQAGASAAVPTMLRVPPGAVDHHGRIALLLQLLRPTR